MASSKSRLYEICAAKHWQPPAFECCEDCPGDEKLYTFKVTVEVQLEGSTTILECHGAPQSKKKMAAQHAAEGALWYLMHLGIITGHN
ncbi:ribonuclease 3-like protein 1 [Actinidia eriantha]|uniref:ribonuclease 3-like protein 1 n=1 Tax=Actinidia eriantha TaxID=165200 RepID=UPI002583CFBC|nr:ribonuclease 3-like protein 1 [Actinidia eriantha]